MRQILVRMRATVGHLGLMALLTVCAGVLLIGAPRFANQLADESLREYLDGLPQQAQEITYVHDGTDLPPESAESMLAEQRTRFTPALQRRIGDTWYTTTAQSFGVDTGLPAPAEIGVRAGNGLDEATELVAGRRPVNTGDSPVIEVMLSELGAKLLKQRLGSEFGLVAGQESVRVRVVGIFALSDPAAPIWHTDELVRRPYEPQGDGDVYKIVYLSDAAGLNKLIDSRVGIDVEWRYRLDLAKVDMSAAQDLIDGAGQARLLSMGGAATTGLPVALSKFRESVRAAEALVAVVQAGTVATLAGLVLLVAQMAVKRRASEFALLRARGGAVLDIGGQVLQEALPVIPVAAALGWILGVLVPGRAGGTERVLFAFTALALLATPLFALGSLRRMSFSTEREDLSRGRVSLPRRTAELSLLAVAVLGAWLVQRRGLSTGDSVDIYLVTVPVLLAAATAVVVLRLLPMPIGWTSRIAARGRGVVGFLGLARAGRATSATVGPIAVLVVSVCTAVFSIGISGTVDSGRDKASDHEIIGDAVVRGYYFAPDTGEALLKVPGVTGVAPFVVQPNTEVTIPEVGGKLGQFYVMIVDGPGFAEIAKERGVQLDPRITEAMASDKPGVLASAQAAEKLKNRNTTQITIRGQGYAVQVAGVVESFPGIPRTVSNFVVVPWQALKLKAGERLSPTGFLVNGAFDHAALVAAGDDGQQRWMQDAGVNMVAYEPVTQVNTWAAYRAELEQTGANSVLTFAYQIGAAGGVVLALLAVGFAVLAGARNRGRVLSRLRTLGLARRQGRRLLLVELAPLILVAVLTGGAVGIALPRLLGSALSLTTFTDGYDPGIVVNPLIIGGALGLVLAGLGTALLVETLFNRRTRLGEVLRLGGES